MHGNHPDYLRVPVAARLAADYGAGGAAGVLQLAHSLIEALPQVVRTEKRGGFLGRGGRLAAVEIPLAGRCFRLEIPAADGTEAVAIRQRIVKGIVLATDELPLPQWLDELGVGLETLAAQNRVTSEALERWLGL